MPKIDIILRKIHSKYIHKLIISRQSKSGSVTESEIKTPESELHKPENIQQGNEIRKVESPDSPEIDHGSHGSYGSHVPQKTSYATDLELLVAEHLYPGCKWTVDTLFQVSNLIAPSLKLYQESSFKDRRGIAPDIVKSYHVPSTPIKTYVRKSEENQHFDSEEEDLGQASIQMLESCAETFNSPKKNAITRSVLPKIAGPKSIAQNTQHAQLSRKSKRPVQFEKNNQLANNSQNKVRSDLCPLPNVYISNYYSKNDSGKGKIVDGTALSDVGNNQLSIIPRENIFSDCSKIPCKVIRTASPQESIAGSILESIRPTSSLISGLSSSSKNKIGFFRLGGLGPDKDNENYRAQVS